MRLKKIVTSAGIAAGALAALAGTANASPQAVPQLPQLDPVTQLSELGDRAGVTALHDLNGPNVTAVHNGTALVEG
ncbi:hypothetical protein ACVDFE_05810 [Lentzea chajnantorensis]